MCKKYLFFFGLKFFFWFFLISCFFVKCCNFGGEGEGSSLLLFVRVFALFFLSELFVDSHEFCLVVFFRSIFV